MTDLLRNIRPQPRLGQSFLMRGRILECEIGYARVGAEDTVLEVGAGIGNLTERLATRAGQVIAIECDQQFRPRLGSLTEAYGNITALWGDALAVPLQGSGVFRACPVVSGIGPGGVGSRSL